MKKFYFQINLNFKYFIIVFFLFGSAFSNAQLITVNESSDAESAFTLEQLVRSVLIDDDCAEIDNFSEIVNGNPDQLTTKSYGFFRRSVGSDFPFDEGVVLTSGIAHQAGNTPIPGINTNVLNTAGDLDLEDELNVANTGDATSVTFRFTPSSNNFSFNYLMASEEYNMGDECEFADAFAFLLREVGETDYNNLALVPVTNDVVSTVNVRPDVIDGFGTTLCNANNPDFFEGYNLGDTNYGGRTVVFNASAVVIPGQEYEIKLVIADQGDLQFDSAVFIEAGSFSGIGSSIPDFTVASGNPACGNDAILLDTGVTDPTATFQWFKEDEVDPLNNPPVLIISATDASYNVPSIGTFGGDGRYIVEVSFGSSSCTSQDDAIVEFVNQPIIENPPLDLVECENDGDQTEVFNLTQNTDDVLGAQTDILVEYLDAAGNIIPDPVNYTNTIQTETITVRLSNNNAANGVGTCSVSVTFQISVSDAPTAEDFTYILCDNANDGDDTNGIVEFNLLLINDDVLGTQDPTQFSVSYHFDATDAEAGANPLPDFYENTTANMQNIFARVENINNTDCYEVSTVTLQVNALPTITASVDLLQCDDDTDGLSNFNLTEANTLISANAANETFTYYLDMADAANATNAITNETAYPNTDPSAAPDVLYVRVENADTCFRIAELELFVSTTQIPATFIIPPYQECDDTRVDDNITDGITVFDFSSATALIEAIFPVGQNITITYYETQADALAEVNSIADPSNHINSNAPFNQTIFYRVDNDTNNACLGLGDFQLETVNPTPRTDTASVDIVQCDDITIGDLSEEFNLRQNEAFIFDGETNLTARYFLSYNDALNDVTANEILTPETYNNTNPTETIFVRVENTLTNCFAIVDFDITVNPIPTVVPVTTLEECENGTDFIFTFNLDEKRDEILNGQDPSQFNVTFHLTQQDADNLDNPQPDMFENTVNPQEIFFAITNTTTLCSNSSGSFFIEVLEGAQANPDGAPLDQELCDDVSNDGSEQFNLELLEDDVLDGQNPDDYTITYHFSENGAITNTEELPLLYENLTNPQTIWVRVSNNLSPDICFEVQPVPLQVNPVPEFDLEDVYVLCNSTNGSEVVPVPPVLETGLSAADFTFEWRLDGVVLPTETNPSLTPTQGGTYSVLVTDITTSTVTQCTNTDETVVLESDVPIVTAEVTSQAFAGNHTIEATTSNVGDFEFSLDLGPYQDSGVFENVTSGIHRVYARDINGCGVSFVEVLVMDYPRFFTPNGDGNHDTWNIVGIAIQPNAKIYIFDRYGKLLKQLSPTSPGWDGTYQGSIMPSDDYWFTVEYIEPTTGETLQQTAHFTLKR